MTDRPRRRAIASIREGDTGASVRDLQRRLRRALGEEGLPLDGVFGPQTAESVRRLQRARGLAADGIVGHHTWRELVEASFQLGDRLLWRSRRMMRGDDVLALQHQLNRLGFNAGPEDGIFGPLTQHAVEEFQRNTGLDADGVAGPGTVAMLQRLQRSHQSGGVGAQAREREALHRLTARGLVGARILIDPAFGPDDPGPTGAAGCTAAGVTWPIGRRLAARLSAHGAFILLSRGPQATPDVRARARLANDQGVDVVVCVSVNALHVPGAQGCASYYFGHPSFLSEAGSRLAERLQTAMTGAGWLPDCRTHAVTWPLLRETRMTAVVVEPGFITSPSDEARLADPGAQDRLAAGLAAAVAEFFATPLSPVDLGAQASGAGRAGAR